MLTGKKGKFRDSKFPTTSGENLPPLAGGKQIENKKLVRQTSRTSQKSPETIDKEEKDKKSEKNIQNAKKLAKDKKKLSEKTFLDKLPEENTDRLDSERGNEIAMLKEKLKY